MLPMIGRADADQGSGMESTQLDIREQSQEEDGE